MAGGTGGHVFPALAVANALRERAREVVWLGTRKGLEARVVPEAGLPIEWISVSGLRGKGVLAWLVAPFRLTLALIQSMAVLIRRRPAAVLGMGGFVSGPGGIAAWLLRRPLVIHEQNAIAGTTNRWLAPFAMQVLEAFPHSFPPGVVARSVGNPVRSEILAVDPPEVRLGSRQGYRDGELRLLVIGGSQGARVLNQTVPAALALLPEAGRPQVWHQTGRGNQEAVREAYATLGIEARVDAFVDDMAGAYGWADLSICRAGALTVAELAAVGLGALLVPYAAAIDDHQRHNAEWLAGGKAAAVVLEHELSAERLAEELSRLSSSPGTLLGMARAARQLAAPDATGKIRDACLAAAGVRV